MNERIVELAEMSGFQLTKFGLVATPDYNAQKFAELIIRECARVDSEENNPDHVDGEIYNQTILQHFGVEE